MDGRLGGKAGAIGWLALILLSSCNTTKFLKTDEFLLKKNAITWVTEEKVEGKRELTYELEGQIKQTPNRKFFFFFPRQWFYYKSRGKSSKFSRWVNKSIGETPTIYDRNLTERSRESMTFLLQYHGFYDARVYVDDLVFGKREKKIKINYIVEPGRRYLVDSIVYFSQDERVDSILQELEPGSELAAGSELDGKQFEAEKQRIRKFLVNHGYAYFSPNFFATLKADTTVAPSKATVFFEVLPPGRDSLHQVYRVGEITVYTEYNPREPEERLIDTLVGGVHFRMPQAKFSVKPRTIIRKLFLKKGALYRYDDVTRTNQALSSLPIFRFVRIRESIDSLHPDRINFRIEISLNKKLELGADFDLSYANRTGATITGNLVGISASPSISHRNLFRGGELLSLNFTAGVEVQPARAPFWNTVDIGAQADILFPKYINFLSLWTPFYLLHKKLSPRGKIEREERRPFLYEIMQERAGTRVGIGYNYLSIIDFYRYNLATASLGYDVQIGNNQRFVFDHTGIDYLTPRTDSAFEAILEQNPFLERSFGAQLFTGFFFRNTFYSYASPTNALGESFAFGINVELSGLEVMAANRISNAISGRRDTFRIGETRFSEYFVLSGDIRYYRQLNPRNRLVARFFAGIARPYGFTSDVPYVKQFFVGGPNSIRAWPARGLGPGGYLDSLTLNRSNRLLFYQSGDLRLEFNIEYRFPILWQLKGALFLDGGNIWTIKFDPDRCGSQFLFSGKSIDNCGDNGPQTVDPFYRQIALGTGFGLRLDLSYFVLRLDMGIPLRNPFPRNNDPANARGLDYWVDWTEGVFLRDQVNFNIGLGYPF